MLRPHYFIARTSLSLPAALLAAATALTLSACQTPPAQSQTRPIAQASAASATPQASPVASAQASATPVPTPTPLACADFTAAARQSLSGTISNELGSPVAGAKLELRVTDERDFATVDACPGSDSGFVRSLSVESDSSGKYRFDKVYPGLRQTLSVSHPEYQTHAETLSLKPGQPLSLNLSLKAYAANDTFIKP